MKLKYSVSVWILLCTLFSHSAVYAYTKKDKHIKDKNIKLIKLEKGSISVKKEAEQTTGKKPMLFGQCDEKQVYSLDNMPSSKRNSSVNVDTITYEDIKEQQTPLLKDLLNEVGSLTVQDTGTFGNKASFRIRGTDRVRVIVDGVRVNNPTDNKFYLDNYTSDDIDRIEVLKGPQGSVNGVQASGGLVSIQTRQGYGRPSVELESGMGSFSTSKERLSIQGGDQSKDYFAGITWLNSNGGMRTYNNQRVPHDGYHDLNITSNVGKRVLSGKAEIRNIFKINTAEKEIGITDGWGIPPAYVDPNDKSKNTDIINSLTFNYAPTSYYDSTTRFGLFNQRNKFIQMYDEDSYEFDGLDTFKNTRLSFLTQHNLKYKDLNTFSVGYGLESDMYNRKSDYGFGLDKYNGTVTQNDVFVNDVINLKDILVVRGGGRLSTSRKWGTYVTPNVSGALILPTFGLKNAYTKVRSSYGHSINTPSLDQLFARTSWATPNPDLKAEKLDGWDIGLEQSLFNDRLNIDGGFFKNSYSDYIGYDFFASQYVNVNNADISGWEVKFKVQPTTALKAVVNYTYTGSEDKSTGLNLAAVPTNRWNMLLTYQPKDKYKFFIRTTTASSRIYSGSDRVKGFVNTSIGATYRLASRGAAHLYLQAQLNNIFNEKYEVYRNYKHPGITFFCGVFLKVNALPEML